MRHQLLRMTLLVAALAIASEGRTQCGPGGCYAAPRPSATPAVSAPQGSQGSLARIVHQEGSSTSLGSGALVATVGDRSYFLTCAHLFDSPGRTSVQNGGRAVAARIVAIDKQHDLALLQASAVASQPTETAESSASGLLTACGYGPSGQLRCVRGPIVGFATSVGASAPSLRIRGSVRSGDSGGPVFNAAGRLVAVIWGERGGETFAMGGAPLRRILGRIPRARNRPAPVERSPTRNEEASDPWRERVEQRLNELSRRQLPPAASLPDDLARHNDLNALSNRWEQRFDRLSAEVRVGGPSPPTAEPKRSLVDAVPTLLAAMGIGGPVGIGLFLAKGWLSRTRNRAATPPPARPSNPPSEATPSQTVVIDTPPPPQQVVSETHYVPYQRDDFARAHQWASEQLVHKFPGSVEMLASLDSLIKQQLNGKEAS